MQTNAGGADEDARLLYELLWSDSTLTTRDSQVEKLFCVCDENMRTRLPASEHDLLADVWYVFLKGKISADSLPQCFSAVYQYQMLHHLGSPTKTPLV